MDIVLGLLGFPSIFVGFGEGVYRGQQSRPHRELKDAVEGEENAEDPLCHVTFDRIILFGALLVISDVAQKDFDEILTEGLEIFDGHKLVGSW